MMLTSSFSNQIEQEEPNFIEDDKRTKKECSRAVAFDICILMLNQLNVSFARAVVVYDALRVIHRIASFPFISPIESLG